MNRKLAHVAWLLTALTLAGCADNASHDAHTDHVSSDESAAANDPDDAQSVLMGDLHLVFAGATVRLPVGGSGTAGGYVEVRNLAERDVVLVAATSALASRVEMHTMEMDGDVMRMRKMDRVVLPAGEVVRFERGGRHLMLFDVGEAPESVEVVFETEGGEKLPIQFDTISPIAS